MFLRVHSWLPPPRNRLKQQRPDISPASCMRTKVFEIFELTTCGAADIRLITHTETCIFAPSTQLLYLNPCSSPVTRTGDKPGNHEWTPIDTNQTRNPPHACNPLTITLDLSFFLLLSCRSPELGTSPGTTNGPMNTNWDQNSTCL